MLELGSKRGMASVSNCRSCTIDCWVPELKSTSTIDVIEFTAVLLGSPYSAGQWRGDGRIAFGKGGGALGFGRWVGSRFEGEARRRDLVERAFRRTYPMLNDVRITSSWTGPIDRTRTGLPFFWPLGGRPDVFVGVGYSGNGVGPSYLAGRILASLVLGRDDEWARCGLVRTPAGRFPPEPFRYLGGHVVRGAIARKERAEDDGRRADRLTKALVRLAPAGLVPLDQD